MKLNKLLQSALFCALVFTSYGYDSDSNGQINRKCRCKKYIADLNKDIDKRLKTFENKIKQYMYQNESELHSMNNVTEGQQLSAYQSEQTLLGFTEDMNMTRQSLNMESYSLRKIQENIMSQEVSMDNLNKHFKILDSVVKNLTTIVEKLEQNLRKSIDMRPQPITMSQPTYHHKKPKKEIPAIHMYPRDCDEVYQKDGMKFLGDYYIMVQPEKAKTPFKVVCKIIDGAGWTVIQRRQDGRENFSRDWLDYKNGFGDLQGEFWVGNEKIHLLTTQGDYEMKIDMEEWNGKRHYAEYERFRVSNEHDKYRLHVRGYHGTAGDSLTAYWRTHDGMPFSTRDNDNDNRFYDNCAEHYGGGWWYNDCFESHLNGKYYQNGSHNSYFVRNGIQWNSIHTYSSLKFSEMLIKPADKSKLEVI